MSTFVSNQTVTNEHAVLLQEVPDCPHLIDYVKAVGSAIGSRHIHSIVKTGDKIKLFLNEKRYVDYVIGAGIVLRGQHAKVEFATPPAAHILVLNVDPMVPDDLVLAMLSPFGIFKSKVIHSTVSEDSAYCHILSGERRVYMQLFDNIEIPDTLTVEYDDSNYNVTLKVETYSTEFSPQISEPRIACVNPVQGDSHQATDGAGDLPSKCKESESHFEERPIKIENQFDDSMEKDDDLFELFSEVNDWDLLLSNDCGQEGDQSQARDKLSSKPSGNICSVKPIRMSHVSHETNKNSQ